MPMSTPCSVLDSPQVIARSFVDDYYMTLNSSPDEVSRFYEDSSIVSRRGPNGFWASVTTIQAIKEKIVESMDVANQHWVVAAVEAQLSYTNGILVVVEGYVASPATWSFFGTGSARRRGFTQSFLLAPLNATEYFIHNDVLLFSDSIFNMEGGTSSGPNSPVVNGVEIGRPLVDLYCWVLNSAPQKVHRFYVDSSVMTRREPTGISVSVTSQQAIREKIKAMDICGRRWNIETVEAQRSYKDGMFIVVRGFVVDPPWIVRRFHQSFFFSSLDTIGKYFALNDILIVTEQEHTIIQQLLTFLATNSRPALLKSEKEDRKPDKEEEDTNNTTLGPSLYHKMNWRIKQD